VVDIGRDPVAGARRQKTKGGFRTRRDAEEALARIVAGIDVPIVGIGSLTLDEFCQQWLTGHCPTVKATTAKCYRERLEWYVLPRLGRVKLADLCPLHIQTLWADLLVSGGKRGGPLRASSVAGVRRALRKALNDAVSWGIIAKNPVAQVKGPRLESSEMRTWTSDEARRFIELLSDDRLAALWVVAITTGMRRGELAGLRWIDIDLDTGNIALRNTRVAVGHAVHEYEPKSRTSRRAIAIDEHVVTVLRTHRRRQLVERLAWGPAYDDTGYVFTNENGELLHPNRITVLFHRHREALELPAIRLHDIRHTSASLMLAAGVHPKVVSERLGHSSIAITLDLYSHVIPGLQAEAAEKLGMMILGTA
jgi:integrase